MFLGLFKVNRLTATLAWSDTGDGKGYFCSELKAFFFTGTLAPPKACLERL